MPVTPLPKIPGSSARARDQAEAYDSMFAPISLELNDGTILNVPPHPNLGMLDDDQQEAYEELMFEVESYDREDDVNLPEHTLASGAVVPSRTIRGDLKVPYRKDGVLVKPSHRTRVVQVALGEDAYTRLVAGGRKAVDVWRLWHEQTLKITDRQASDSKSK